MLRILKTIAAAVIRFLQEREREVGAALERDRQRTEQDERMARARKAGDRAMSVDPDSVLDTDPDVRD